MSLNSEGGGWGSRGTGGHREEFNDTVFEVLGAENSKNDVVERGWGGHGGRASPGTWGEFNDTVFEVLGAENSKNDVVELSGEVRGGGGGVHGGRGVTGDAEGE